jgi:hypothetical protein
MPQRGNPRIGEQAKKGSDAQKAKYLATWLTAAAWEKSPANLGRWIAEVREEFPDASDRDVEVMARARQSQHFRSIAARRKAS